MNRRAMKFGKPMLASAIGASTLLVGAGAVAATGSSTNAGHALYVIGEQTFDVTKGPIQFADAIGDYGKGEYVNAAGKATPSGNYYRAALRQGDITLNVTELNKRMAAAQPTVFNLTTCSGQLKVTSPVTVSKGTGPYKGVSGTLTVATVTEFKVPRISSGAHKGQCNVNSLPMHAFTVFTGKGTVKL